MFSLNSKVRFNLLTLTLALVLGFSTQNALAQSTNSDANAAVAPKGAALEPTFTSTVRGERLSDWLSRSGLKGTSTRGLAWLVPEARAEQAELKAQLLTQLANARGYDASGLISLLQKLPVTGRVALASLDLNTLLNNPNQNPVLAANQALLPMTTESSNHVRVISIDGTVCLVPVLQGMSAQHYLAACSLSDLSKNQKNNLKQAASWAWVAQPDGRSERYGVASWNETPQPEVQPGSWIWAPPSGGVLTESPLSDTLSDTFSTNFIRFIATQVGGSEQVAVAAVQQYAMPNLKPTRTSGLNLKSAALSDLAITASNWGDSGLMQTPSARMSPAGEYRLAISNTKPYTRITTMLQPLDWLEAGFRYTDIGNIPYGFGLTNQSLKDKSIDFKAKLLDETRYLPQIAVGMRDIGGTGLFSSEYIVGSKRTGAFDWSLGLGWGNMGSSANIKNPFSLLSSAFNTRGGSTTGTGGTFNVKSYFRGPTALFGGVQWQSPNANWVLKAELEGNNYQNEPASNNQVQKSPINLGVVYRYSPTLDFNLGFERGNTAMLGLVLHAPLAKTSTPKVLDQPTPKFGVDANSNTAHNWSVSVSDIEKLTGWTVNNIEQKNATLHVTVSRVAGTYLTERKEKLIAVLHRDADSSINGFVIHYTARDTELNTEGVDRREWVLAQAMPTVGVLNQAPRLSQERAPTDIASSPLSKALGGLLGNPLKVNEVNEANEYKAPAASLTSKTLWEKEIKNYTLGYGANIAPIFGGPDKFALYQVNLRANAEYRINASTWVNGFVNFRALDNYKTFTYTGQSNLPRARTYIREFATGSRLFVHIISSEVYVTALGCSPLANILWDEQIN